MKILVTLIKFNLNGTRFWSSAENACVLPGSFPSRSSVTNNYTYDPADRPGTVKRQFENAGAFAFERTTGPAV